MAQGSRDDRAIASLSISAPGSGVISIPSRWQISLYPINAAALAVSYVAPVVERGAIESIPIRRIPAGSVTKGKG